jgi:hypothetical protein
MAKARHNLEDDALWKVDCLNIHGAFIISTGTGTGTGTGTKTGTMRKCPISTN